LQIVQYRKKEKCARPPPHEKHIISERGEGGTNPSLHWRGKRLLAAWGLEGKEFLPDVKSGRPPHNRSKGCR